MAYDGRVMRLALERFDEDRRARSEEQERRRERVFARQPRLREIEGELRSTMSRIIAQALRQGTDPVPAVERLRMRISASRRKSARCWSRWACRRIIWRKSRSVPSATTRGIMPAGSAGACGRITPRNSKRN